MRLAVVLRLALYILIGGAAALWVLAVRMYPEQRTLKDEYVDWKERRALGIHEVRRACSWRLILCEEFPVLSGSIAPAADSMLSAVDLLTCARMPMPICWGELGDTAVYLLFDEGRGLLNTSRQWTPSDLTAEYARIHDQLAARFGPSSLCPQNDDLAYKENRRWQLADRNIGITKVEGRSIALDVDLGRIYCHTR